MRKITSVLACSAILLAAMAFTSCGKGTNTETTPVKTDPTIVEVQSAADSIYNGYLTGFFSEEDLLENVSNGYSASLLSALENNKMDYNPLILGSSRDIPVKAMVSDVAKTDATHATAKVTLVPTEGSTDPNDSQVIKLVFEDGTWKIDDFISEITEGSYKAACEKSLKETTTE